MLNGINAAKTATIAQTQKTTVTASTQALQQTNNTIAAAQDDAVKLQANIDNPDGVANGDIEQLIEQRDQIQGVIDTLTKEADALQNQIDKETKELENLVAQYEKETASLEDMENEFTSKQNKLADLNAEIDYTQKSEQKRYEGKISDLTSSAIDNYNPEKDGDDFNAYLDKVMSGAGFVISGALDFLNSDAQKLANDTNYLMSDIKTQAGVVRNLSTQIATKKDFISKLQNDLDVKNNSIEMQKAQLQTVNAAINKITGAGLSGTEVLSQISECEKQLAIKNNIDLTEKFEDGSPKYVVARGQDDKYHIYEMDGPNSEKATSLARKYGSGSGLKGKDIVPVGSGYMRGAVDVGETSGRAVYAFSCVSPDLSSGEACSTQKCYSTCSPLSFDVDGDGVKTSSQTVRFDIDGDGKLDTVNNSAEWVLAFDKDHDGIAGEDGSELFGDNTDLDGDGVKDGYANGFEALQALAKKEGLVGPNGGVLDAKGLKVLEDKYGLVMTNGYGGEAKSLSELGITEINLSTSKTQLTKNFDGRHNDIMTQEGATFKVNGQTREYADIWNAKLDDPKLSTSASGKNVEAKQAAFDMNSIDLESALKFLDAADRTQTSFAMTKQVDYNHIAQNGKASASLEQAKKSRVEEAKEEVQEKVQEQKVQNDGDDDFINFQKKKLK